MYMSVKKYLFITNFTERTFLKIIQKTLQNFSLAHGLLVKIVTETNRWKQSN